MPMNEIILLCLLQMWKDLVPQDVGLCTLKIKLFLLSLAHQGLPLLKDLSLPPGTPSPPRKPLPDGTRAKREALARRPRPPRYDADDDEENKENLPQDDDRKGYEKHILESLLQRLEEDLTLYQEEVLHELNALRQRLRIPQ
uniref:E4 protein n=1 Tax=Human papillomavirus TaxID=10566 RepID=A0A385PJ11_9PAPI|nr:MAG: E4 protein [Human papillomavirus]